MKSVEAIKTEFAEKEYATDRNIPFNRNEIKEHFKTSRTPLLHEYPNRAARRQMAKSDGREVKQVQNNRAKTKGRLNNKVLNRMSYFYLQLNSHIGMARHRA